MRSGSRHYLLATANAIGVCALIAALALVPSASSATTSWSAPSAVSRVPLRPDSPGVSANLVVTPDARGASGWWPVGCTAQSSSRNPPLCVETARSNGGTWADPTYIALPDENASRSVFALAADGIHGVAAWQDQGGSVRASRWNGSTWSPVATVSRGGDSTSRSGSLDLDVSADGSTAVLAWWSGTSRNQVWVARAAAMTRSRWSAPVRLGLGDGHHQRAAVAADGSAAAVTWESNAVGNPRATAVRASLWSGARWSREKVLSPRAWDVVQWDVAISDDGRKSTVLWSDEQSGVQAATYRTGRWTKPVNIALPSGERAPAGTGFGGSAPRLAMSSDGSTVLAAWTRTWSPVTAGESWTIQSAMERGGRWSPVSQLGPTVSSPPSLHRGPEIAVSPDGRNASAVWLTSQFTGVDYEKTLSVTTTPLTAAPEWEAPQNPVPSSFVLADPSVAVTDGGSQVLTYADVPAGSTALTLYAISSVG